MNYYGEEGCCLVCPNKYEGCLCYKCKCTKCSHYTRDIVGMIGSITIVSGSGCCDISVKQKRRQEIVFVEPVELLKETEKAYLLFIDDKEIWFPKSLTDLSNKCGKVSISLPWWLAIEKGIWKLNDEDSDYLYG